MLWLLPWMAFAIVVVARVPPEHPDAYGPLVKVELIAPCTSPDPTSFPLRMRFYHNLTVPLWVLSWDSPLDDITDWSEGALTIYDIGSNVTARATIAAPQKREAPASIPTWWRNLTAQEADYLASFRKIPPGRGLAVDVDLKRELDGTKSFSLEKAHAYRIETSGAFRDSTFFDPLNRLAQPRSPPFYSRDGSHLGDWELGLTASGQRAAATWSAESPIAIIGG